MAIALDKYQGASKWLRAKDLTDLDMDAAIVTICNVFEEAFEARDNKAAEDKLCVQFKEFDKPLGLNVTNTKSLVEILGEDTDEWDGRKVKLRVSSANNPQTGMPVDCLRIVAAPSKTKPAGTPAAKPKTADDDDPYSEE